MGDVSVAQRIGKPCPVMSIAKAFKQVYATVPFKQPVLEVLRRKLRLPQSLTQHMTFRGPFTVQIDESHQFRLQHWGFLIETELFWNGLDAGYEGTSLQVWRKLASHAEVILDIGANTGVYTLLARCVNRNATIFAMEPVERVFRRLCRNLELNNYEVIAKQVAASDLTGTATIFDPVAEHELTASLNETMPQGCHNVSKYQIATTRVDDFLRDQGLDKIDLVKIDVELFEPEVLRGMGAFLSRCRPSLLIEILNDRVAREVSDLTRDLGYSIFQIVEGRGLVRCDRIQVTDVRERNYLLADTNALTRSKMFELIIAATTGAVA
jgi:FkbM family methyltransferase